MDPAKIESFMSSPLLKWLQTLPEAPGDLSFRDLTSGPFLHNVLQSLDPNISTSLTPRGSSHPTDFTARVSNIDMLVAKIKSFYEDVLDQCLVIALPEPLVICQESPSPQTLQELDKLLILILGAAVQCSQREHIIESIKNLPYDMQHSIAEKIREVTENPSKIWTSDLDDPSRIDLDRKDGLYSILVSHVKRIVQERDSYAHKVVEITLSPAKDDDGSGDPCESYDKGRGSGGGGGAGKNKMGSAGLSQEKNHLALEVSESKAKIRKLNQLLEEKTEAFLETKEELEKFMAQAAKLKQENLELTQEARASKALRDELDILRERASKVDKLEVEMQRYKDKVSDIEFYKSRVEELREDNRILIETKEMLEDQLENSRKRSEQLLTVESELLNVKTDLANLQMEREADQERISELLEENLSLQLSTKNSFSESQSLLAEMEQLKGNRGKDTNILAEKYERESTRIHQLELEKQKLISEVENLKLNGFHETSAKILVLEKENKKFSMTIKQLESLHAKDTECNLELESQNSQLQTKIKQLEEIISTLKESQDSTRIEKETEIENLTKQVESLRKRQEKNLNEQVVCLEEENRKLVKERTLLQTQVTKLEHEKQKFESKTKELENSIEILEDTKSEKEELNSQLEELLKENEELKTINEEQEKLTAQYDKLRDENTKLSKNVDKLRTENSSLQIDKGKLETKLKKLSRQSESMKVDSQRISQLESERDELRERLDKLQANNDFLTALSKKHDDLEQKVSSQSGDISRYQRQVTKLQETNEQLTSEVASLETENKNLKKSIETLKTTSRRVEQLEKDNIDLEGKHHKMERENKSVKKEVERLKEAIEERAVKIDDLSSKLSTSERDRKKLEVDLEMLNQEQSKLRDLELKNQELSRESSMNKRTVIELREELVKEKLKAENLASDLESLNKQLEKLGIDQQVLNGDAEPISEERMKNLEGSMTNLLEIRQKKITSLEKSLKEAEEEKLQLQQELKLMTLKAETGNSKPGLEEQLSRVIRERDQIQGELLNLQMEVGSRSETLNVYKDKFNKIQAELVNVQVENSTLQSQSSSLLAQISQLQTNLNNLENQRREWIEKENMWEVEKSDLVREHAAIQALHDNIQQDYEALQKERDAQKDVEKHLKSDLRKLQSMSLTFSEDQEELLKAKAEIEREKESVKADARTLANLRSEHARLKDDFRCLFTTNERLKEEYRSLQSDYKTLKDSFNQMKLEQTELKGQLYESREQVTHLDMENSKLNNRIEVLSQMNSTLEEDRRHSMDQFAILLAQYHDLLTQTLEDKELFHEEEKTLTDRLNNLHRQKEKLEEKIFEQYRKMENSPPKKIGLLQTIRQKVIGGGPSRFRSTSRSRSSNNMNNRHHVVIEDNHDSSSVGSAGSGSLDSTGGGGNGSTNGGREIIPRSESAYELRKVSNGGSGSGFLSPNNIPPPPLHPHQYPHYRGFPAPPPPPSRRPPRKNPMLMEDSDGNNADNDSVNSFVSGNSFPPGMDHSQFLETESIATPDTLPNQSYSSHSDIGIPIVPKNDGRSRSVNRIYVNGSDPETIQRSGTPKLTSWKSTNSSPTFGNEIHEEKKNPPLPARKPSRSSVDSNPPKRPPKPVSRQGHTDIDTDSSAIIEEEDNKKLEDNTSWYEYGCV